VTLQELGGGHGFLSLGLKAHDAKQFFSRTDGQGVLSLQHKRSRISAARDDRRLEDLDQLSVQESVRSRPWR